MSVKTERAEQLFKEGYNCSQAVLGAFCEDYGLDLDTAFRLASSFGGGMGSLREVCGTVTGMFMVAGLMKGYSDSSDKAGKKDHYQRIRELAEKFKAEQGSIVCREILGLDKDNRTIAVAEETAEQKNEKERKRKTTCGGLVKFAVELIEKEMEEGRL